MTQLNSNISLQKSLYDANIRMEQAEVMIGNLLSLKDHSRSEFLVSFDDIVVTLETAVRILRS